MPNNTSKNNNSKPKQNTPKNPVQQNVTKPNTKVEKAAADSPVMAKEPPKPFDFAKLWENIKPPVILTIICVLICALLVVAYNLTYVDNTGVITDKLRTGCEEVIGKGKYEMLTDIQADGVTSIIVDKENKTCAFEITADGYSKGGLHVLIGIDKTGAVSGISFIAIGETPGLGTKVQNSEFLDKFKGLNSTEINVDNITGATYSSKGMKKAVALAIETYQNQKEAIFSE